MSLHPTHLAVGSSPSSSRPSGDAVNVLSLAVVIAVAVALFLLVVLQRGPERVAANVSEPNRAAVVPGAAAGAGRETAADVFRPMLEGQNAAQRNERAVRDDLRPR